MPAAWPYIFVGDVRVECQGYIVICVCRCCSLVGALSRVAEIAIIHHFVDQLFHIIRLVRIVGDQRVEAVILALNRIIGGAHRRLFAV